MNQVNINQINNKVGGIFKDTGEGDVDFYTYWYSICYLAAMLNTYRYIFRDIDKWEQVLCRFLQSRGIAFKHDDALYVLQYLYYNWERIVEKRGTSLINESLGDSFEIGVTGYASTQNIEADIMYNSGIGVISNGNALVGTLKQGISIGFYHIIQFDVVLVDSSGNQYDVSAAGGLDTPLLYSTNCGVYLRKLSTAGPTHIASYRISYNVNGVTYSSVVDMNVKELNTIKYLRNNTGLYLYINDELKDTKIVSVSTSYAITALFGANLPAVANINVWIKDSDFSDTAHISWRCNEGSGFIVEANNTTYSAVLSIRHDTDWGNVWVRQPLFNNTGYVGIDGELKRLLSYDGGECLFELISEGEMGLCIDLSSPLSEEANCANLNKAYNKGVIDRLSKYPMTFTEVVKPYISGGYIQYQIPSNTVDWFGLNSVLNGISVSFGLDALAPMKPNGCMPFIPIPVATQDNNMDGYEVSFVIYSTANIQLSFGLFVFDCNYVRLLSKTKSYVNNAYSDYFLDESNFSMCKGRYLWVRGVYSLQDIADVNHKLNIGVGNNLYNTSTGQVKYVVPIIAFRAASNVDVAVRLKDIVVRPLSLNTTKGIVCNKNLMVGYLHNESGQSDADVDRFINEKLIPYNCITNIQYL